MMEKNWFRRLFSLKPRLRVEAIAPGLYHSMRQADGTYTRFHLRVEPDGSGMLLAFPHVTASIFPGWVFNVATLVHGEEAFLAAVFLFTVHFFNNHFRPDKMPPPDVVMFTGTQSLEEFRRDHALQYSRLVETGQLEKYLVDAPSRPMTLGSKILGLVLIACGLGLLIIVATGFFSG